MRRPVRQWVVLVSLALGLAASAIGATFGQPNSWLWFVGGVAGGVGFSSAVAAQRWLGRRRRRVSTIDPT